jgi:hypothetical protein
VSEYVIRYNQTRGQPGRGTVDHVWRVFEDGKEYLTKNVEINVPCRGAKTGGDYSMVCEGKMTLDRDTSTAVINKLSGAS